MIKVEHTLFALPFAFLGAVLAAQGIPNLHKLFWITVAMVGARSAAMAFNRLIDCKFDSENPRTAGRALPLGIVSPIFVCSFTLISSIVFFMATVMLNRLTLLLSPIALGSVLLYSYTKRFTHFSHFVLGWCLAIAPSGAWIAVRGNLGKIPLLLSLIVLLWTAGFDVMYACQDFEYDRNNPLLHSIPKWLGINKALQLARLLHVCMLIVLVVLFYVAKLQIISLFGIIITALLIGFQHRLVTATDLSRMNAAFFTTNAIISVILFLTISSDIILFN